MKNFRNVSYYVVRSYRSWRSLNSHPHGPLDTDLYARHIPVGRVCAQRTSRAPLTETDLGNMYAGSYVFAPGPCAYDGEPQDNVTTFVKEAQRQPPTSISAPVFALKGICQLSIAVRAGRCSTIRLEHGLSCVCVVVADR